MKLERDGSRSPAKRQLPSRMRRAAVAGALGTVAQSALMQVGMKMGGGQRPIFLPNAMVQRMARRIGYTVDDGTARLIGNLMRAGYGPAWGVAWERLRTGRSSHPVRDACLLGSVIWVFELAVLPRVGATPQVVDWPRRDIVWDLGNALAFAAVYTCAVALMDSAWSRHEQGGIAANL